MPHLLRPYSSPRLVHTHAQYKSILDMEAVDVEARERLLNLFVLAPWHLDVGGEGADG